MESNFSQRLISARKMAGLSLRQLAEKLDIEISKQALNKYEKGLVMPNSQTVISLANALDVPVDFFFRGLTANIEGINFRKKPNLGKKDEERIKQEAKDFVERYIELEKMLNINPKFKNPLKNNTVRNIDDVNTAADQLRRSWRLGTNPIPNVIGLLEKHEIKIRFVDAPEGFSGLSFITNDIPVIIINKKMELDRIRFTALHELAHIILCFPEYNRKSKNREKLCHAFAGAFLFPKEKFLKEFGLRKRITMQELGILKLTYGMSFQAIMARALILGLIKQTTFKEFNVWLNKNDYKKQEPVKFIGTEAPMRFKHLLYHSVAEGIISLGKAASLDNKKLYQFKKEIQLVI